MSDSRDADGPLDLNDSCGPSGPCGLGGSSDLDESLAQLAAGMHRVANGNFDTQLDECPLQPYRDIFADFNAMTASLLNVEALRESFVSNVAHEFKTPLSYIQGYATLLQDDDLTPKQRSEYVRHITKAARRLSDMIGNLLEISNLSRPNAQMEVDLFSLDEQLRHVLAVMLPAMMRKQLTYEVDLATLDLKGNESLLEDAWMNLVSNAVKYTASGGRVSVSLKREGAYAVVVVADTGCGMSCEQVEHAFDRFYQGDETHAGEGNGLGLAIVKAVVKKHDGSIAVESEPGHGTAFTVRLPM